MKNIIQFSALLFCASLNLFASDGPKPIALSEMRVRYAKLRAQYERTRADVIARHNFDTNYNNESYRLDEFIQASSAVGKLERRPSPLSSELGLSRMWNNATRIGSSELRPLSENYLAGPENEVILHSLELQQTALDLAYTGRGGLSLAFRRAYHSNDTYDGPMGRGWDFFYNARIVIDADTAVLWMNGLARKFSRKDGNWDSAPGNFMQLVQDGANFFVYSGSLSRMEFEPSPETTNCFRLKSIASRHGDYSVNRIEVCYQEKSDRIENITDPHGRVVRVSYDKDGRIVQLCSEIDDIRYSYDADGCLVKVTSLPVATSLDHVREVETRYEYAKVNGRFLLARRINSGSQCAYCVEYDKNGYVSKVGNVDANGNDARWQFVRSGNLLVIKPTAPAPSVEYVFDPAASAPDLPVERRVVALSSHERFNYSQEGLLCSEVNVFGVRTEYKYDIGNTVPFARGNVLSETTFPASSTNGNSQARVVRTSAYAPGTAFPVLSQVKEFDAKGFEKVLSSVTTTYSKDWEVAESNDNGIKTRYLQNKYGEIVLEMDAVGTASITHYADNRAGKALQYAFEDGGVLGGGFVVSVVDDATDEQIKSVCAQLGVDPWYRDSMRVRPVARVSHYSYDANGRQIASRREGFVSLSLFNRDGGMLADYVPGSGLSLNEYSSSGLRVTGLRQVVSPVAAEGSVVANNHFRGTFAVERLLRNAMGNVVAHTLTDEKVDGKLVCTKFERYPGGTLKKMIDPSGLTREDIYDAASGLLQRQVLVNGGLSQTLKSNIVYDFDGSAKESVDALGDKTIALRDEFGRPNAVITADGVCAQKEMDGLDRTVCEYSVKDGKELTRKEYEYGANGKLSASYAWRICDGKRERLLTQQLVYDDAGHVYAARGVREKSWSYRLSDGMGREVAVLSPGDQYDFSIFERGTVAMKGSIARGAAKGRGSDWTFLGGQMMFCDTLGLPQVAMPIDRDWKDVPMRRTISRSNVVGQNVFTEVYGQTEHMRCYNTLGWTVRELTVPKSRQYGEGDLKTEYAYFVDSKIKTRTVANRALLIQDAVDGSSVVPSLVEAPQTMVYEYDPLGRLTSVRQPDGLIVRRVYDDHSLPVQMCWTHATEPDKILRHIGLDFGQLGRLTKISDKLRGKTIREYGYDDYGNCIKSVDVQGAETVVVERKFDSFGTMREEKTIAGGHEFPIRHEVDLAHGRDALSFNNLLARVGNRGYSSKNWREQETRFGFDGQIESIVLDKQRNAYATWHYQGPFPLEREVPESALKMKNKFDARGDLESSAIYKRSFRFGGLDYRYDGFGNPIYSSTRLAEGLANSYENAQYSSFSAHRQLVAQNSESVIPQDGRFADRHGLVLGGEGKSLQALKTSRMAYDQAGNRWVDYNGQAQTDLSPDKFGKENLSQMLSPARTVKDGSKLSSAEMYELASNREVTQAAYSNDVLTAKSNEYDHLGNMVKYDGRFWNGMCEYPVVWSLDFDMLGRLAKMHGTLSKETVGMKVGELVAELRFLYDAENRRVEKEVVDHTRIGREPLIRKYWTVYDGNMQTVVFREEGDDLYWAEQYLWKGQSRELVMACLAEDQAENVESTKMSRYYFQQDRGLNTVCVTRSVGNNVLLVSGASYLGFGKDATMARVAEVGSSLGRGDDVSAAMNRQLDDQRLASWTDEDGVQYLEITLSERSILNGMSIWHDGSFPKEFRVYVPTGDVGSPAISSSVSEWENIAFAKGCLRAIQKDTDAVVGNRPLQVGLGALGNTIVIVWDGRASRTIRIREIEVSRASNNPGSIAFAGQWLDRETGLYYQINRYRMPSGVFLSPDPLGFAAGDNLYAYANGNPLEWHDPDGRFVHVLWGALGGAALNGGFYALQCWWTGNEFSWKEFGIQVAVGAAVGAVSALTFGGAGVGLKGGLSTYLANASYSTTEIAVYSGMAAGAAGGFTGGALNSALHGEGVGDVIYNGLKGSLVGAAGGAAGGAVANKLGVGLWGVVASGASGGAAAGAFGGVWEGIESGGSVKDLALSGLSGMVGGAVMGAGIGAAGHGLGRVTGKFKKLPVGNDKGDYPQEVYDSATPEGLMVKTKVYKDAQGNRCVRDSNGKFRKVDYGGMETKEGYARHHKKPLSLGGTDTPDNVMYMDNATHRLSHPGAKINNDPVGTFYF